MRDRASSKACKRAQCRSNVELAKEGASEQGARMFVPVVTALRPLLASALLAVWAVGGVVLPVAHDVGHSGEQVERAERIAETHDDHHHHEAESLHGTEAQPYCPETVDIDLICAVCSTHAAAMLASSTLGLGAPTRQIEASDTERWADSEGTAHFARGPPTA